MTNMMNLNKEHKLTTISNKANFHIIATSKVSFQLLQMSPWHYINVYTHTWGQSLLHMIVTILDLKQAGLTQPSPYLPPSLTPISFSTFLKIWAWPSSPVNGAPHAKIFLDFGKGAQHYLLPVFLFPWQIFSFFQHGK